LEVWDLAQVQAIFRSWLDPLRDLFTCGKQRVVKTRSPATIIMDHIIIPPTLTHFLLQTLLHLSTPILMPSKLGISFSSQ